MRRTVSGMLTVLLFVAVPLKGQPAHSKRALVIGNGVYHSMRPVPSAHADAVKIAMALTNLGFAVDEQHDLKADALDAAIRIFDEHLGNDDIAVLYYSGHAVQDSSENFLLPVDFNPAEGDLATNAISVSSLEGDWVKRGTYARIIILDACHATPDLQQRMQRRGRRYEAGLSSSVKPGTLLLLAAQENQPVPEYPNRTLSPVAESLSEALAKPGLKADDVLTRVTRSVRQSSNGTQYPQKNGDVPDFFLTGEPEIQTGDSRKNPKDGQLYVGIGKGIFSMGCVPGDDCPADEKPQHAVQITHGFWIAQTAVTVQAYGDYLTKTAVGLTQKRNKKDLMPKPPLNNRNWEKTDRPMVKVLWEQARDYCSWVGGRLPTEAEWEYVAREGKTDISTFPNASLNVVYSTDEMPAVRAFGENALGVSDMGGIIWEWCADLYDDQYFLHSPAVDPSGPPKALQKRGHVRRGGAYKDTPGQLRISRRGYYDKADNKTGFRCVIDNLPPAGR